MKEVFILCTSIYREHIYQEYFYMQPLSYNTEHDLGLADFLKTLASSYFNLTQKSDILDFHKDLKYGLFFE